jgi:hypothetical protein
MLVKCMAVGFDSMGERDIEAVIVDCTQEQYNNGEHYEAVEEHLDANFYEVQMVMDEHDRGGHGILDKFVWESISSISI